MYQKLQNISEGKDAPHSQLRIFNTVNMAALILKLIYRFNPVPLKTPSAFFAEIDNLTLKFI